MSKTAFEGDLSNSAEVTRTIMCSAARLFCWWEQLGLVQGWASGKNLNPDRITPVQSTRDVIGFEGVVFVEFRDHPPIAPGMLREVMLSNGFAIVELG
jgi:hypothetical protein